VYDFLKYRVDEVMTPDPICIGPDRPLAEAAAVFDEHDFNALPVVDGRGRLQGVVTKLDILSAFRFTEDSIFPPYDEIMARPVEDAMTRDVFTTTPKALLTNVLAKLVERKTKSFPVLDSGRVVGIVSREDVLRGLRRATGSG